MPIEPGKKRFKVGLPGLRERNALLENQFAAPMKRKTKQRKHGKGTRSKSRRRF